MIRLFAELFGHYRLSLQRAACSVLSGRFKAGGQVTER
jgi:hypothetical protein